jgi:hypothetical protein
VDFYKKEGLYHHFDGMVGHVALYEALEKLLKENA